MANNDPAKEWGLPDWRNADSYTNEFGRPDEWSDDRLRWEFKRRQPEYRWAFDDLVRAGKHGTRPAGGDDQREKFGNSYIRTLTETALNDEANNAGFMFRADEDLAFLHQMFFLPNPRFSNHRRLFLQTAFRWRKKQHLTAKSTFTHISLIFRNRLLHN